MAQLFSVTSEIVNPLGSVKEKSPASGTFSREPQPETASTSVRMITIKFPFFIKNYSFPKRTAS